MELILRVRPLDGEPADLVVDVETTHTVNDLARALARQLGRAEAMPSITLQRTGTVLEPASIVADVGIVSGDELVVGPPRAVRPVRPIPPAAVTVDTLAGPDAGSSYILLPGTYSLGRDDDADVHLGDPTVSRRHAQVTVDSDWTVTVRPLPEAQNGVSVNDRDVVEPTVVLETDVIGMGGTRLSFRRFVRAEGERVDQLGQIEFQRTPYRPPVVSTADAPDLGPIPERGDQRRFQVLAVLAPLAAGLTLFAFSRQPQFLALTLMSPLVMVANSIDDKRSGRKRFRHELAAFRERLIGWRAELDALVEAERIERVRTAPDLAELARRAELRTVDLWARSRDSPDFLRLRAGLGSAPTMFTPELPRGGDVDLRADASAALVGLDEVHGVPITVDLAECGVVGLHGPDDVVNGVASSMVIQAACLHSPEDLTVVAAVGDRTLSDWMKWLPHTRSVVSPLPGPHVATTRTEADILLRRLLEVLDFRRSGGERDVAGRRWPWIMAVLDARLAPDPAGVARLLDECPEVGISVIWLADTAADVPRQATEILVARQAPGAALVGTLWSTDPEVADREIDVEQLRSDLADRVARALAPIRDASTSSLATSIPRGAPLLEVLGVGKPSAQWVTEHWLTARPYGLPFPVGMGVDGQLSLDLVEDGPHMLIGGTSGAGKSELLQSIVASLAVHHPPTRLNFLFVDYKGGASSTVFSGLPHTVGYVTNLDAELSLRALTSLRAELNRRMRVMEGRAKDLAEMREVAPDDAPPSLVIVVDEFATLVKEVPEFVAGIVDIAQRGRSLGIHLILATQRPSGSVNENILANTNLRISLRMLDRPESTAVIGSPEAADIPVPLKGRGYARLGPSALIAFQSAFGGAPLTSQESLQPVLVAPFVHTDDSPKAAPVAPSSAIGTQPVTHLQAVLAAIAAAATSLTMPDPIRPWRDVLPELVTIDEVLGDPRAEAAHRHPGRIVGVGMIDAPERQDQYPALIDLEETGGWLVFGAGGAGKTTLLRTIAVSAAASGTADQVVLLGLDFASRGLGAINALAQVVDVATGDNLEAVTRHLAVLHDELGRRRRLLADARAEHLTAYNERHDPLPRILVLLDGFGGFMSTFGDGTRGGSAMASAVPLESWIERLVSVVVDGRQVGIHTVITADRRNAVPARIHAAIGSRLIMRHADETGYNEHGISSLRAKALDLSPGRGLWDGGPTVQIAAVAKDPSARGQSDAIADFAALLGAEGPRVLASAPLPEELAVNVVVGAADGPFQVPLGVADISAAPVVVDLTWSNLTVAGPPRSGRTTVLNTAAAVLSSTHEVWAVGPSSSPLDLARMHDGAVGRADDLALVLERLANLFVLGPGVRPRLLLVDDLDRLDDPTLNPIWEQLADHDDFRMIATIESRSMTGYTASAVLNLARRSRRLLVLRPDDAGEFLQMTGIKPPIRPGVSMPPGRGVLVTDREPTVIQVARA